MNSVPFSSLKLGLKEAFYDQNRNKFKQALHILPPLQLFRKDLLNSGRTRERFRLEGHKYFAKLSASGPETAKILKNVKKSSYAKFIRSFEFDP